MRALTTCVFNLLAFSHTVEGSGFFRFLAELASGVKDAVLGGVKGGAVRLPAETSYTLVERGR